AAEDPLDVVRRRLEGICTAAGHNLADLDLQVITAPTVRLDLDTDRRSLEETVAKLKPRLLVLDPFVRLHRIDENASGEVAPLLAFLRELQRRHAIAVLVVHHAKKGAGHIRAGQALRGSSEFHAWGDSNLYLRRQAPSTSASQQRSPMPSTRWRSPTCVRSAASARQASTSGWPSSRASAPPRATSRSSAPPLMNFRPVSAQRQARRRRPVTMRD